MRLTAVFGVSMALITRMVMGQSLPYNPTTAFLSPADSDLAYIFLPSSASSFQSQLASLNISSTLQASTISLETLSTSLPFETGNNTGNATAYLPYIFSSGSIGIYAGSCIKASSLWMFNPDGKASKASDINSGNGTWAQISIELSTSISTSSFTNANFLASAFSFATVIDTNDIQQTIYAFGGMCPTTTESDTSIWQSSAIYSNNMLKLAPSTMAQTSYEISITGSGSRPIAEAGFTITGLTPTYSNSTSGYLPQAQNFLLIGGHTKDAFINMSQVALFSLPQESWTFQSVDSPGTGGNTELAVKSASSQAPDSRSGHSSILTADGKAVIVFGGWVGNVNTPADPQLAILHLGSGFGGTGAWQWEIPTTTGTGLSSGQGIYGHGAVLLPGDVMMVIGGNQISNSSSRKMKRVSSGTQALFFNTTSLSWVSSYTNPTYVAGNAASTNTTTSSNISNASRAKKVGLGAGIGLGFAAVTGAILVYFLYVRKLKKRERESRERTIHAMGQNAVCYSFSGGAMRDQERSNWWRGACAGEMAQTDQLLYEPPPSSLGNRIISSTSGANSSYGLFHHGSNTGSGEHDDNGYLPPIPSTLGRSVSIPRKPVSGRNARGYYQPAPSSAPSDSWAHARSNSLGTAGAIHPIYEADEEDNHENGEQISLDYEKQPAVGPQGNETDNPIFEGQAILRSVTALPHPTTSDPFRDPSPTNLNSCHRLDTSQSPYFERRSQSPESTAEEREREIREWVADWAGADTIMNSKSRSQSSYSGRVSPTKENYGRTESNLSERSIATMSAVALSRNSSMNQRSNGLTALFGGNGGSWNPFSSTGTAAVGMGSINKRSHGNGDVSPVSQSSREKPPQSSGSGTSSFTTAQTSLSFPQMRAEGESLLPRPKEYTVYPDGPGSPSKTKPMRKTQQSRWFGTLKRVLSGNDGGQSGFGPSSSGSSPQRNRSPSLAGSPTRSNFVINGNIAGSEPRRTVSASALWRRKQGPGDWEDSADPAEQKQRSNTLTLDGMETGLEEEWDIERAIERRVVQVMFTVPKDRLRVVNADIDGEEKSDAGSILDNQRESGKEKETEKLVETGLILNDPALSENPVLSPTSMRPGSPGKLKGRVQELVDKMESGNI